MAPNFGVVLNTLRAIAPYAPVPLYAESLRVHKVLTSAILTRNSVSECLTGCINDFVSLWDIRDVELLNRSSMLGQTFAVTSIRHGNEFDLTNSAVLQAANVFNQRLNTGAVTAQISPTQEVPRDTTITIAFITPWASRGPAVWRSLAATLVFFIEVTLTSGMSYLMAQYSMYLATCLLICVNITTTISFGLRQMVQPRFGNRAALEKDRLTTTRGTAALDVHIIADSWNSSKLLVLCGYSSQLHSLTNIPIRCSRPTLFTWACRILAAVLSLQGALLAAVANTEGNERWASLVWIAAYICMLLFKKLLHTIIGQEDMLSEQPGAMDVMPPLIFSSRRAALIFISLLPVSEKVDRWAWWNVFMPDNARRRDYLSAFEGTEAFAISRDWRTNAPHWEETQPPDTTVRPYIAAHLQEAIAALAGKPFGKALQEYLRIMQTAKGRQQC